jgi:hypothetical protein
MSMLVWMEMGEIGGAVVVGSPAKTATISPRLSLSETLLLLACARTHVLS